MGRRKTIDLASQQYYKFEKWILAEKSLKKLSPTSKLLYMVLRDREEISLKNTKAFTDKEGCLFQYFDQEKASELLGIGLSATKKAFNDLIKYELIESVRQGQGKPNRLYVLEYEVSEDTLKELSYKNKKDLSAPTDKPINSKTNNPNKSICNTPLDYTPVLKENIQEDNNNEPMNLVKEARIAIAPNDRKTVNEKCTNIDVLKVAIVELKEKGSFGINALMNTYEGILNGKTKSSGYKVKETSLHHGVNKTFDKYTPEELEKKLKESQRGKFGNTR